ncbi:hypothetical protein CWI42_011130 [Ordospora colligata]|uniref:Spindle assembly abnormal protein 6 N-terminal domain-containing protein n=1 Tax=Ordospora colligata OC4 TaxID=1354746 RepID=A0A0B2UMF2_9MICR|nr:uncharacterized protein M896_011130 [Ordospora colligata OC4]KHN70459.1 hypothetical protein M896_011130 [Ordospora colligata OC4]TBU17209.1 hypothetical protein CWI41_011130 [Ordospora colligata]TBU17459.1 hypothetical protein CWI40_011130 [Ordospora colligata]TBU19639.1 hypothetical protein CWI42_011130 [Ordospora colligata]
MRESIFSGKVPITCPSDEIPWQMKCEMVRSDDGVEIRLIDTRDMFTFYLNAISPSDFYVMKREQDIIVDYDRFVNVLVKMLHGLQNGRLSGIFSRETNRFVFVEKDEFRNIVRLELQFSKPDESHYKQYLGDILGRMESDNIRLIKENEMLREKCKGYERDAKERRRYLEEELAKAQKKAEKLFKENAGFIESMKSSNEDLSKLNNRIYELEKENSKLQYDLEKLKLQEVKNASLVEKTQEIDEENRKLKNEINTANEIIRKCMDEVAQMKSSSAENDERTKDIRSENKKLKTELDALRNKVKDLDDKHKRMSDDSKAKDSRLKDLEIENGKLVKKLENAQSVYSHFYSKNIENPGPGIYSDNESLFSIVPESPPH